MPEESGNVVSVEKGTAMVGLPTGAVTLDLGEDRIREEGWEPGGEVMVEFADDGETIETFRLVGNCP
jgi:hypothetical protein